MEKITFSGMQPAQPHSYPAGEQARQTTPPQPSAFPGTSLAAQGSAGGNSLAAAQLARQRAVDAGAESATPFTGAAGLTGAPASVHGAGIAPVTGFADTGAASANAAALAADTAAQPAQGGAMIAAGQAAPTVGERLSSALARSDSEVQNILDQMEEARKKAQEMREKLKLPKNGTRYGLAAVEAYARLARARSQSQVSSAAGYARRQLGQMQTALRQDPENAGRIRAAIRQLQSAVTHASRKKRELEQERIDSARRARAKKERRPGKAKRIENEMRRKQEVRRVRDSGYVQNAVINAAQQEHIEQQRAAQREQLERIAGLGSSASSAVEAYTAQAAPSTPVSAPMIQAEG